MFHGILLTNAFLRTDKFVEHYTWLQEAAGRLGISLTMKDGTDFFLPYGNEVEEALYEQIKDVDFILYWDKDIPLGKRLTLLGKKYHIPIFNSIEAIDLCDDKASAYDRLSLWNLDAKEGDKIPLIPTVPAPMTYQNTGYTKLDFVPRVIENFGLPMVIKECRGSFGMQVYLAETEEKVFQYTKKLEGIPFLYQKYIEESAGRDIRLQVVGDRVVASMYRYSENGDFRANLTNGGSMKPYDATEREKALAVRTVKALGLDFAGVDLLFAAKTGEADLVCEVNSNAHFKNIYTCTGVNTADHIMEYIAGRMKDMAGEDSCETGEQKK